MSGKDKGKDGEELTFTVTMYRRKVQIVYRKSGPLHVFSSPDFPGASAFNTNKHKSYESFVKNVKDKIAAAAKNGTPPER